MIIREQYIEPSAEDVLERFFDAVYTSTRVVRVSYRKHPSSSNFIDVYADYYVDEATKIILIKFELKEPMEEELKKRLQSIGKKVERVSTYKVEVSSTYMFEGR
jgi:hypothetical protein